MPHFEPSEMNSHKRNNPKPMEKNGIKKRARWHESERNSVQYQLPLHFDFHVERRLLLMSILFFCCFFFHHHHWAHSVVWVLWFFNSTMTSMSIKNCVRMYFVTFLRCCRSHSFRFRSARSAVSDEFMARWKTRGKKQRQFNCSSASVIFAVHACCLVFSSIKMRSETMKVCIIECIQLSHCHRGHTVTIGEEHIVSQHTCQN